MELVQSVLFQSPYSGCRSFSGWPKDPCQGPPPSSYPPQQTSLAPRLCVDSYRPGFRQRNPIKIATAGLQPVQRRACPVIPTRSFKVCQGPSTMGPMTIRNPWYENNDYSSSNAGAGRLAG